MKKFNLFTFRLYHFKWFCLVACTLFTASLGLAQPANNSCATAVALNCNNTIISDNQSASDDSVPTCGMVSPGQTVWYILIGTGGNITASTCHPGTDFDSQIAVYTGSCGSLTCVAGNNNYASCSEDTRDATVTWASTASQTYYLVVAGVLGAEGNFELSIECAVLNDLCTDALTITCGNTYTGWTQTATTDTGLSPCGTNLDTGPGVWYEFTGDGSFVTISTCNDATDFDTRLGVFESTCSSLTCVGGNDDDSACGFSALNSTIEFQSVSSTTYYIYVTSYGASAGDFELSVTCSSLPTNDDVCSAASLILGTATAFDNTGATVQTNEPSPGIGSGTSSCESQDGWCSFDPNVDNSIWYTFIAPASGCVNIEVTDEDLQLAVWTVGNCTDFNSFTEVAANDDGGINTAPAIFNLQLTPSTTYYIQLDGYNGQREPDGSILVSESSECEQLFTPGPQSCAEAVALSCGDHIYGNNQGADDDSVPTCGMVFPGQTIWYTISGTGDDITLSTCYPGTDFDIQIGVYSGSCGSLTCVAGNNNDITCTEDTRDATVTWTSNAGQTYYVVVAGVIGAEGNFELSVTCANFTNDNVCNAEILTLGVNSDIDNTNATVQTGEVDPGAGTSCSSGDGWCDFEPQPFLDNSVWYNFVAPKGGCVDISASGADLQLAVYTASDCSNFGTFVEVGADDNNGPGREPFIQGLTVIPGETYWVQVDGYEGATTSSGIVLVQGCEVSNDDISLNYNDLPEIEIGLDADYSFFQKFNTAEEAESYMRDIFADVCNWYFENGINFDLTLREPHIWTTPDPYNIPPTNASSVFIPIRNFWDDERYCEPVDIIIFYTGKNLSFKGQADPDACNDTGVAVIRVNGAVSSGLTEQYAKTLGHEFGHLLNQTELQVTTCPEKSVCGNTNGPVPIMCQGSSAISIFDTYLSEGAMNQNCTREIIEEYFETNLESCFGEPRPSTILPNGQCPICDLTVSIAADNINPTTCSNGDIITYTVNVCNYCEVRNLDVDLTFSSNTQQIFDQLDDFQFNFNGTSTVHYWVPNVEFEVNECMTFQLQTQLINEVANQSHKTTVEIHEAGESETIESSSILIDASSPVTVSGNLSQLIADGDMLSQAQACNVGEHQKIEVSGTLTLDDDYCFNNSKIYMEENAKIVITNGKSLEIVNSEIIPCGSERWDRIELEDGADLTISNSILRSAVTGIEASGSGTIVISNSDFIDMSRGIYNKGKDLTVVRCNFDQITTAPGLDGIAILNEPLGIHLGFRADECTFNDCNEGIKASFVNTDILRNTFTDMNRAITVSRAFNQDVLIAKNTISDVQKEGIYLRSNNGADVRAVLNTIDANTTGIRATEHPFFSNATYFINQNTITVPGTADGVNLRASRESLVAENVITLEDNGCGIKVVGSPGVSIVENAITGAGTTKGVGIENIGSHIINMECNTIDDTKTGVSLDGMMDGSKVRGNEFESHLTGLFIQENGNIGTQSHNGNLWLEDYVGGSGSGTGADSDNTNVIISSAFAVDANENPQFLPTTPPLLTGWFDDEITVKDSYACPVNPEPVNLDDCEIDELDAQIAKGTFSPANYQAAMQWTAARHLYGRLIQTQENKGSLDQHCIISGLGVDADTLEAFLLNNELTTIGLFDKVSNFLPSLYNSSLKTAIKGLREEQKDLLHQLHINNVRSSRSYSSRKDVISLRQALLVELQSLTETLDSLESIRTTDRYTDVPTAEGLNNQISPQFIYETNQHTVNDIFLRKIAGSIDTFTTTEQNQLLAIANQCPFAGGDAVIQARSLYNLVDPDISWSDDIICNPPLPLRQAPETLQFRLYPNPAQEYVLIEREKGYIAEELDVILHNALGKVVLQTKISDSQTLIYTSMLSSGVYTVSILDNGRNLQTSKIILVE